MKKHAQKGLSLIMVIAGFFIVSTLSSWSYYSDPLNDQEKEALVVMIQEAKLSKELAQDFNRTWKVAFFNHIVQSEELHINQLKRIIRKNNGTDPLAFLSYGLFHDQTLQEEFKHYTAQGQKSVTAALFLIAQVQEKNILSLGYQLDRVVNPELRALYANRQHFTTSYFRMAVQNLGKIGVIYEPQLMSSEQYKAIMDPEAYIDILLPETSDTIQ
jgi:hypothetical protein